jgi:putative membrane protein
MTTAAVPTPPTPHAPPAARRGWHIPTWAGITAGVVLLALALLGVAAAIRRHRRAGIAARGFAGGRMERFGSDTGHVHWLFWILVLLLAAAGIALLVAALRAHGSQRTATASDDPWVAPSTAEQILAERYARGEIDDAEFRARRDVLRG